MNLMKSEKRFRQEFTPHFMKVCRRAPTEKEVSHFYQIYRRYKARVPYGMVNVIVGKSYCECVK